MSKLGDSRICIIGAGNMGDAIAAGLSRKNIIDNLTVFDSDKRKQDSLAKKYKIRGSDSITDAVDSSDIIIIAVKPQDMETVLEGFGKFNKDKTVVSIAAGIRIEQIERKLGPDKKIIRVMPNTPALIGEGMSVLSPGNSVDDESLSLVTGIFENIGIALVLPEKFMDAVTGLSGSGPAYVFTFIQALTDGGVKMGIPRDKASVLAIQTVIGSAKMLLETGEEPISMRSRVTSPGGTTIEAVHLMEKAGFSGIVMDAVEAATNKSKKII